MYTTGKGKMCTSPPAGLSTGGMMKIAIPIFACPFDNESAWKQIAVPLDTNDMEPISYEPFRIYDNLNSGAGYVSTDTEPMIPGTKSTWPSNTYHLNLSTRSNNPLLGPLYTSTLSYQNYSFGETITVEYQPLNFDTNCGIISVEVYNSGLPNYIPGINAIDNDGAILGISCPRMTFELPKTNSGPLANQRVIKKAGESIISGHQNIGWDHRYDGPSLRIIYHSNSKITEREIGQEVGQVFITFSVTASSFITSRASLHIAEWTRRGFVSTAKPGPTPVSTATPGPTPVSTATPGPMPVSKSFSGSVVNSQTSSTGYKVSDSYQITDKYSSDCVFFNATQGIGIERPGIREGDKALLKYVGSSHIKKVIGDSNFEHIVTGTEDSDPIVAGGANLENAFMWQRAKTLIDALQSLYFPSFNPDNQAIMRNGIMLRVRATDGVDYFNTDRCPVTEDLLPTPTNPVSFRSSIETQNEFPRGLLVPSAFPISRNDRFLGWQSDNAKEIYAKENIFSAFTPYYFQTENANHPLKTSLPSLSLTSTLMLETNFKSIDNIEAPSSIACLDGASVPMDEPIELNTVDHSTLVGLGKDRLKNRLTAMQIAGVIVKIPQELDEMPELKAKFVENKRLIIARNNPVVSQEEAEDPERNGFLDSLYRGVKTAVTTVAPFFKSTAKDGGNKVLQFATQAGNIALGKSSKNPSANAEPEPFIATEGDTCNARYKACGTRMLVKKNNEETKVDPAVTKMYSEFTNACQYYCEMPNDIPQGAPSVEMNRVDVKYTIYPNITLAYSSPIYYFESHATGGEPRYTPATRPFNLSKENKKLVAPNVMTDCFPTIIASRWPMTDPRCVKNAIMMVNPVDCYQLLQFTEAASAQSGPLVETALTRDGETNLPMITVPLVSSNAVTINAGFCTPDKLLDENGILTDLADGETYYMYVILKMVHTITIPQIYTEQMYLKNIDGLYNVPFSLDQNVPSPSSGTGTGTARAPDSVPFPSNDDPNNSNPFGIVFSVMSGNKCVMTNTRFADIVSDRSLQITGVDFISTTTFNGNS